MYWLCYNKIVPKMQQKGGVKIYKCRQCHKIQETPLRRRDGFDNEIYGCCRYCGGNVSESEDRCRCCGRELFAGEKAYEVGTEIYCGSCVTEIIV